jgi:hypothetical protein
MPSRSRSDRLRGTERPGQETPRDLPAEDQEAAAAPAGPPSYNSDPPTSGPHGGSVPCGVRSDPVPDPPQVHALEHGAVMVQYRPEDLSSAEVRSVEGFGQREHEVMVAPRPDSTDPVEVTAWTKLLALDRVDSEKIQVLIDRYRGTTAPEAGAPCPRG